MYNNILKSKNMTLSKQNTIELISNDWDINGQKVTYDVNYKGKGFYLLTRFAHETRGRATLKTRDPEAARELKADGIITIYIEK